MKTIHINDNRNQQKNLPTGFRASAGLDGSLALLKPAMFIAYTLN